jgi:diaminopimelate decarboxylase
MPARSTAPHAVQERFPVVGGELLIAGQSVARLAARVGQTPFYAIDRGVVRQTVAALRARLPPLVRLHYAVKANPMPALLGCLAGLVDGADVASAGEMQRALDAGFAPADIGYAGPGKRDPELAQAVAAGVCVNLESEREVDVLAAASRRLRLPARVAVRVNPPFELKGSGMRMGGGGRPFGVDAERVPALLQQIGRAGLAFEGFHLYAGSQNLNAQAIVEAQRLGFELALELAREAPSPVLCLNLGGGYGVPYFPGEQRLDLDRATGGLAELAARADAAWPGARLVLELGRYLVAEAGLYVVRVIDRKLSRGEVFLVVDGGLHQHLAASGNLGQVFRRNFPLGPAQQADAPATELVSVVGPLCTPLDRLADAVLLPPQDIGALLVVFQSGAYGASASPQAFLGHPPCAEVLV